MLNQVHWLHRQAEKATRKGHIQEAIDKHREAVELLNKLLGEVVQEKARESLRLQAEFHEKEQKLLHQYKHRISSIEKKLTQVKLTAEAAMALEGKAQISPEKSPDDYGFKQLSKGVPNSLQTNIYRAFEEAESLIDQLKDTEHGGHNDEPNQVSTYSKMPKDDKVIIEELEVANCHLRRMVDSLFVELDHCQRENADLKARIQELETQLHQEQVRKMEMQQQRHRNQQASEDLLPELPPLDVPNYDP